MNNRFLTMVLTAVVSAGAAGCDYGAIGDGIASAWYQGAGYGSPGGSSSNPKRMHTPIRLLNGTSVTSVAADIQFALPDVISLPETSAVFGYTVVARSDNDVLMVKTSTASVLKTWVRPEFVAARIKMQYDTFVVVSARRLKHPDEIMTTFQHEVFATIIMGDLDFTDQFYGSGFTDLATELVAEPQLAKRVFARNWNAVVDPATSQLFQLHEGNIFMKVNYQWQR
jgi:hypothetical protein